MTVHGLLIVTVSILQKLKEKLNFFVFKKTQVRKVHFLTNLLLQEFYVYINFWMNLSNLHSVRSQVELLSNLIFCVFSFWVSCYFMLLCFVKILNQSCVDMNK